jgi:hypothetical protein
VRVEAPPFDPERIVVLPHAVARARQRGPAAFAGQDVDVRREVARRVVEACERGQVYTVPPRAFTAKGTRRRLIPFWQRVVVSGDFAFVVDVARAPMLEVVTTLVRAR